MFLHLICGTTFFGIIIATFYYIARSIYKDNQAVINYSVKASYFGDVAIFAAIIIQLYTSSKMVTAGHYTMAVPWIFVAYHAFGTLVLFWAVNLIVKLLYFSKTNIPPFAVKTFYVLNIAMILIFMLIIHDAVTQSTWFEFLFRK